MIFSCDVNAANLFFLQEQGKIRLFKSGDFEFWHYEGVGENRNGWLLPVEINEPEVLKNYVTQLFQIDGNPSFVLLTEEQKNQLKIVNQNISFNSDDGDSDYIYSVEKMANLPGKDFQKKRNHVSRFLRTYGENWKFEIYDSGAAFLPKIEDFQKVYLQWKQNYESEQTDFLAAEEKSFNLAMSSGIFEKLGLVAGMLYVEQEAAAFIVASFTGTECLNVHFEKCVEEVAANGGLAVLNQQFAKVVLEKFPECRFLNREEDLNIPGLRKSKLSYKPEFMLKKYSTVLY